MMDAHDGVDVRLYGPGTPSPEDMPTRTESPKLTTSRTRLLASLSRYVALAFESGISIEPRLSLLEAHKIVYLMQSAGLQMGLQFTPHLYGPFSVRLNQELAAMEGHHLLGYGDGTLGAKAVLQILHEAAEAAEAALASDPEFERSWEQVRHAVSGYEYPEGMELLATTHYLASNPEKTADQGILAAEMAAWSPRKQRLFRPSDIASALDRLRETALIADR